MSTLGGTRILALTLAVPLYGAWRADVVLEGGDPPAGAQTLTVGDLALAGTVLRADLDAPDRPHAVIVASPGWDRAVPSPLSYQSDGGVRLSTVLRDVATMAAEAIEQPSDRTMGSSFGYPATGRLRDVLATLARAGYAPPWRSDPDGTTRFGVRAGAEFTGRATRLRANAGVGVTVYGVDAPMGLLPGNTLGGAVIQRLVVQEVAHKLEAEVWT